MLIHTRVGGWLNMWIMFSTLSACMVAKCTAGISRVSSEEAVWKQRRADGRRAPEPLGGATFSLALWFASPLPVPFAWLSFLLQRYLRNVFRVMMSSSDSPLRADADGGFHLTKHDVCEFSPFFKKGIFECGSHGTGWRHRPAETKDWSNLPFIPGVASEAKTAAQGTLSHSYKIKAFSTRLGLSALLIGMMETMNRSLWSVSQ